MATEKENKKERIRETIERLEEETLSQYASLSKNTRGRVRPGSECDIRTAYQRDRDRILHCTAFRRLKDKTQVFLSPMGDHYRTRLTHTLEVSQIARTIARALRINEDLTEAIALGHDLGHTPFGHAGERALNDMLERGFLHNLQSVRVVDHIESNGKGLNLTYEVKNGIACHSSGTCKPSTLEGQIVKISDKIAYINHDIEDAIRGGVLREADLPYDSICILGNSKSKRITTMVMSIIENTTDELRLSNEVLKAHERLRAFMFEAVYTNPVAKSEEGKADGIVKTLYSYYLSNIDKLPKHYLANIERFGKEQAVADYIAGMADQFAVELYKDMYIPKSWRR